MRPRKTLRALLLGILASSAGGACGSGGPGMLNGGSNDDRDGGANDASGDARADAGPDVRIECRSTSESANVQMQPQYCYGWQLGLDDAGQDASLDADAAGRVDPATCPVDCFTACTGAFQFGSTTQCVRVDATQIRCTLMHPCGRATEGFVAPPPAHDMASLFASYAELEAAAVVAFERMVFELEAHGAPPTLVERARESADDERVHARLMKKLAKKHGAEPTPRAASHEWPTRSLAEIALENAVEGCARETMGALLALHQAEHAPDRDLRRAMRAIAPDEVRHAELSWQLASWIEPRLSEDDRARVEAARNATFAELARTELPFWRESGMPEPHRMRSMAQSLAATLRAERAAA